MEEKYRLVTILSFIENSGDIIISISSKGRSDKIRLMQSVIALVSPAGRSRRPPPQLLLILDPVVLVCVGGVNHLRDDLVVRFKDQNGTCVFVLSAVVSCGEDGYQGTSCEALEAVHHTLVGTNDHVKVIFSQEALHSVWAELDDVSSLRRIPQVVGVDAELAVRLGWIRPEDVEDHLGLVVLHLMHDLQGTADLLDILKSVEGGTDSAVEAEDLILDKCSEGQPVEQFVDTSKDRILTLRLLLNLLRALVPKPEVDIDLAILVVATNEVDLFGVDALQGQQKTDGLKGVAASVHKVSEEDVVEVLNVLLLAVLVGGAVEGEETHQVSELSVDVAKDLEGRLCLQDHRLVDDDLLSEVAQGDDLLSLERDLQCLCVHVNSGLEQHVQEVGSYIEFIVELLLQVNDRSALVVAANHWLQQFHALLLLGNRLDLLFSSSWTLG